jgi:hypothetical protein
MFWIVGAIVVTVLGIIIFAFGAGLSHGRKDALGYFAEFGLPVELSDSGAVDTVAITSLSQSDARVLIEHHIGRLRQENAAKKAAEADKIKAVIREAGAEIRPIVDERLVEKGLIGPPSPSIYSVYVSGTPTGHVIGTPTPRPASKAKRATKAKKARRGK